MIVMLVLLIVVVMMVVLMLFIMVVMMVVLMLFVMVVVMVMVALTVGIVTLVVKSDILNGQQSLAFRSRQDLIAGQLVPGSCDDSGLVIMGSQQLQCSCQFFVRDILCSAEDDGAGAFDLIVIELAEILHIDLALGSIGNGNEAVELNLVAGNSLDSVDYVGELTDARGLNNDPVGMVFFEDFVECLAEVAHEGAADTAGVHLVDLDPGLFEEAAVNADLAELIFNQHELFVVIALFDKLFDEGCFSGSEETGKNVDFCHKTLFLSFFDEMI